MLEFLNITSFTFGIILGVVMYIVIRALFKLYKDLDKNQIDFYTCRRDINDLEKRINLLELDVTKIIKKISEES